MSGEKPARSKIMWQGKRGPKVWRMGNWEKKPGADVPTQHIDFVCLDDGDHTGHITAPDHGGKIAVHGDDCHEVASRIVELLNDPAQVAFDADVEALAPHVDPDGWKVCLPEFEGKPYYPGRALARKIARNILMVMRHDVAAKIAEAEARGMRRAVGAINCGLSPHGLGGMSMEECQEINTRQQCAREILAMIPTQPAGGADDAE